ncbi:unnamed protein product [Orchesella dallaii]|uniref:C2H2-type domain-containing protein n=1 Tax=Orchesella dallaii TaxID=48710 RepID=A0ABP1RF63_9HEXA
MFSRSGSPTLDELYNRRHRIRPGEDVGPTSAPGEDVGPTSAPGEDVGPTSAPNSELANKPDDGEEVVLLAVVVKPGNEQPPPSVSRGVSTKRPNQLHEVQKTHSASGSSVVDDRSGTPSFLLSPASSSNSTTRVNEVLDLTEAERRAHFGPRASSSSRTSGSPAKEVRYVNFRDRSPIANNKTLENPKPKGSDFNQHPRHSRSRSPVAIRNGSRSSELTISTNRKETATSKESGNAKECDWEQAELNSGSESRVHVRNDSKGGESTYRRNNANNKGSFNTEESRRQQRHSRSRSPLRMSERSPTGRETTNYSSGREHPSSRSRGEDDDRNKWPNERWRNTNQRHEETRNRWNQEQSRYNKYGNTTRSRKWSEESIPLSNTPYPRNYRRNSDHIHYSPQRRMPFNRRDMDIQDRGHRDQPPLSRRQGPASQSDDPHQHAQSNISNIIREDESYNGNQRVNRFGSITEHSSFSNHYPINPNLIPPQYPTRTNVTAPQINNQSGLLQPSNSNQSNVITSQNSSPSLLPTPNPNEPNLVPPINVSELRLSSSHLGTNSNNCNTQNTVERSRTHIQPVSVANALKLIRTCKEVGCSRKGHTFSTRKEAIEHLAKVHDKELCFICFATIRKTGADHRNHVSIEHEDIKALSACPIQHCGVRFGYGGMYQHQVKSHYLEEERNTNNSSRRGSHLYQRSGSHLVRQNRQTNIPTRTSTESGTFSTQRDNTSLRNSRFNSPAAASTNSEPLTASSSRRRIPVLSSSPGRTSSVPMSSPQNDTRENNSANRANTKSTSGSGTRQTGSSEQRSISSPSTSSKSSYERQPRKSSRENETTTSKSSNVASGRPLQLIQNPGEAAIDDVEHNLTNPPKDTLSRYRIPKKRS